MTSMNKRKWTSKYIPSIPAGVHHQAF